MSSTVELLYAKFLESKGVSIDSRSIREGDLFFGLKGDNFNGGKYAQKALENGASYAVVDDAAFATDDRIYVVEDALVALQDLARFHRDRFRGEVFALTGSNGKTTTKELIREVLAKKYVVHATEGNFNNHIGVPLTVLQLHPQIEIAIIEMGANHVGEIAFLSGIAKPNLGLITNIGKAHTETFGGIEGVLRGKSELFDFLRKNDGKAFINLLDDRLKQMTHRFGAPGTYPAEDLSPINKEGYAGVQLGSRQCISQLSGTYNYQNLAAAITLGRYFKVPEDDICAAIAAYVPSNHRSQIIRKGSNTIILDAYNANPSSMTLAIQNLAEFPGELPKMAILGDMNEVEHSLQEHQAIGDLVARQNIDQAVFIGAKMKDAHERVPGSTFFETTEEVLEYLREHSPENHVILVKASRSMQLETLMEAL